jgi:chromosome partitioning protein
VALVSQKGGSGKSTVAVHLAVCALRHRKRVAILDLDPQGSAAAWSEQRAEPAPSVVRALPARLRGLLDQARAEGADFCFVDSAPHVAAAAAVAIHSAQLVIIPCQPAFFDLAAIAASVELAGDKGAVLLNRCFPRGGQVEAARAALSGVPVVPVILHQRVAFARALNRGQSVEEFEPAGAAAGEIRELYEWTLKRLKRGT